MRYNRKSDCQILVVTESRKRFHLYRERWLCPVFTKKPWLSWNCKNYVMKKQRLGILSTLKKIDLGLEFLRFQFNMDSESLSGFKFWSCGAKTWWIKCVVWQKWNESNLKEILFVNQWCGRSLPFWVQNYYCKKYKINSSFHLECTSWLHVRPSIWRDKGQVCAVPTFPELLDQIR